MNPNRPDESIRVNPRANANPSTSPGTIVVDSTNPLWKGATDKAPGHVNRVDAHGVPMTSPAPAAGDPNAGNSG